MNKKEKRIELTPEEKRNSLEASFWDVNAKMDKNSKLYKEIQEICKDIEFNK